jgi:hypothetical protein
MTPHENPGEEENPRYGIKANNTEVRRREKKEIPRVDRDLRVDTHWVCWFGTMSSMCNGCQRHSMGIMPWVLCPLVMAL